MTKRWQILPLSEVARVQAGDPAPQAADDFTEDGTPFVRMQDVGRYGKTTALVETKDRVAPHVSARLTLFPSGSILVPKSGASIRLNHRAILAMDANVVSHLAVIQTGPRLNNRFLYYWLSSVDLSLVAHDADMPSLKTSDLATMEVPVPPLPEQERIVGFLDEAEALRQLRQQADRRTAEFIPALFHEMFGDPGKNPKRWPIVPVSSFVQEFQGGQSILTDGTELPETKYRVLKVSAVTWKHYQPEESKPVPPEYEPSKHHIVRSGDLLFSRANTVALVAATVYVFETPPNMLLSDKTWRFVWREPQSVEPLFVWSLFQHPSIRAELSVRATGTGGSMKNISKPKVLSLPVPMPPVRLQRGFAERVAEVRGLEAAQAQSRLRLDALFASLLDRAFKGEL